VANCLCEKAGVTRGELDAFVEKKKAEMVAITEAQKATMASEGGNAQEAKDA
jgi:hypothetical protein